MYNFKIKQIITNNGTAIIPKSINIIIGPNNSGKSQFLKDIKNSLSSHNYLNKKNITIRDMEYILPKIRKSSLADIICIQKFLAIQIINIIFETILVYMIIIL